MRSGLRITLLALLLAVVVAGDASASSAATPSSPRNGAKVKEGADFMFDWRWGPGEYYGGVYISRYRSMKGAEPMGDWDTVSHSGPFKISGAKGSGYHIGKFRAPLTGVWFWQVCAVSIHGEDDKCSLSGPVFRLVVVPRKVTFAIHARLGENDNGVDSVVVRVDAKAPGEQVDDYKLCWRVAGGGKKCTGPNEGLGTYVVYAGTSRNDYAIPINSTNVPGGRFDAWVEYGGKKVASYSGRLR